MDFRFPGLRRAWGARTATLCAPRKRSTLMTDAQILDDYTADLFDLDAQTVDGSLLAVDAVTDNGCGTQPNCVYPDPTN
jgi:hypothetical protein